MNESPRSGELAAEVSTDRGRRLAGLGVQLIVGVAVCLALLWQGGVNATALWAFWGLGVLCWVLSLPHLPTRAARASFPWLWMGLGAFHGLQLVPLPRALVQWLNPRTVALSDASMAALGLEPASTMALAVNPGETASQGALYLMLGALVALYGHGLMRPDGAPRASRDGKLIGVVCVVAALLWGLSYGRWMSKLVPADLRLTLRNVAFINPNHLAGVCAVGLALMMRSFLRAQVQSKRNAYLVAAVLLGGVAVLTGSKGGVLACLFVLFGSLATVRLAWRNSRMAREELLRRGRVDFGLKIATAMVLVSMMMVPFIEAEVVPDLSGTRHINKVQLLREASDLIGPGWLLGEGPGALPVVAAQQGVAVGKRMDFMENILLQRLLDVGLLPSAVFFFVLCGMLARTVIRLKRGVPGWGVWLAAFALLLQNLADFSIDIAAGLLLLLICAVHVERFHKPPKDEPRRRRSKRKYRLNLLVGTAVALSLSGVMLSFATERWHRDLPARFAKMDDEQLTSSVQRGYLHSDFAFMTLCRRYVSKREFSKALPACDRAVSLRPSSRTARLLRFVAEIDGKRPDHLQEDLLALTKIESDERRRCLKICMTNNFAASALVKASPKFDEEALLEVGRKLYDRRPDLVERMVMRLREAHPEQTKSVEFLLARLYIARGRVRAADRIATNLMRRKETNLLGWETQAELLLRAKKFNHAFVLFDSVCRGREGSSNACIRALLTARNALSYEQTLRYAHKIYMRLRSVPEHAYLHWLYLAQHHFEVKRYERAISAARRALGLRRNDPRALALETRSHLAISDWRAASRSVKLMPTSGPWATEAAQLAHEVSVTRTGGLAH